MGRFKKILLRAALAFAAVVLLAQAVQPDLRPPPATTGRDFLAGTNSPPPKIAALLRAACYDCHSRETLWPWYSRISPVSWWIADHVNDGRRRLNFSEWPFDSARKASSKLEKISDALADGSMPLPSYGIMHPAARLSPGDRQMLADWATTEMDKLDKLDGDAK